MTSDRKPKDQKKRLIPMTGTSRVTPDGADTPVKAYRGKTYATHYSLKVLP